ncbi:hypothetical protein [Thalassotalea montiporae]
MDIEFIDSHESLIIKSSGAVILEFNNVIDEDGDIYRKLAEGYDENLDYDSFFAFANFCMSDLPEGLDLYHRDEERFYHFNSEKKFKSVNFSLDFDWRLWSKPFTMLDFGKELEKRNQTNYNPNITIDYGSSECFVIECKLSLQQATKIPIKEAIFSAKKQAYDLYNSIYKKLDNRATTSPHLEKEITFEREHQKAGIAILQNFGSLLNDKYPEGGVSFSLKQSGLKISMVIEHPEGEKEVIEDYLNRYGLVVTGQIKPEEFSNEPLQILDLKRQLIQLESDLKWANEKQQMLTTTIQAQDRQIESLENHLKYFQSTLTDALHSSTIEVPDLITILQQNGKQTEKLLKPLIRAIQSKNKVQAKIELEKIDKTDKSLKEKINDFVLTTLASGGGNTPAWIDFINRLPQ